MALLQSRPWSALQASHQLCEQAMACFESKWLAREACHGHDLLAKQDMAMAVGGSHCHGLLCE
jgi:hypothetical protein